MTQEYRKKRILRDADNVPIPQYWDEAAGDFKPMPKVAIDGDIEIGDIDVGDVGIIDGGNKLKVNADGSIDTQLTGSLIENNSQRVTQISAYDNLKDAQRSIDVTSQINIVELLESGETIEPESYIDLFRGSVEQWNEYTHFAIAGRASSAHSFRITLMYYHEDYAINDRTIVIDKPDSSDFEAVPNVMADRFLTRKFPFLTNQLRIEIQNNSGEPQSYRGISLYLYKSGDQLENN